jgi:hypothetical protein
MSFRRANKALILKDDDLKSISDEMDEKIGKWLHTIEVNSQDYLVCVFKHSGHTRSNIVLPPGYGDENNLQGVAGKIVKAGPNVGEQADRFHGGIVPVVGQWVMFRVIETVPFLFGPDGYTCRFVEASNIRAVLTRPDVVF